jgi:hypothetical protein
MHGMMELQIWMKLCPMRIQLRVQDGLVMEKVIGTDAEKGAVRRFTLMRIRIRFSIWSVCGSGISL